jgi:hypothetical protein
MDFEAFAIMVPMVRPCTVMLLVVTGVGLGLMCPNSSSEVRRGAAILGHSRVLQVPLQTRRTLHV